MAIILCCQASRPSSPPLPNNRPVPYYRSDQPIARSKADGRYASKESRFSGFAGPSYGCGSISDYQQIDTSLDIPARVYGESHPLDGNSVTASVVGSSRLGGPFRESSSGDSSVYRPGQHASTPAFGSLGDGGFSQNGPYLSTKPFPGSVLDDGREDVLSAYRSQGRHQNWSASSPVLVPSWHKPLSSNEERWVQQRPELTNGPRAAMAEPGFTGTLANKENQLRSSIAVAPDLINPSNAGNLAPPRPHFFRSETSLEMAPGAQSPFNYRVESSESRTNQSIHLQQMRISERLAAPSSTSLTLSYAEFSREHVRSNTSQLSLFPPRYRDRRQGSGSGNGTAMSSPTLQREDGGSSHYPSLNNSTMTLPATHDVPYVKDSSEFSGGYKIRPRVTSSSLNPASPQENRPAPSADKQDLGRPRGNTNDTTSSYHETESSSLRTRQLEKVAARFAPRKGASFPRPSKFKEELGEPEIKSGSDSKSKPKSRGLHVNLQNIRASYDGSEEPGAAAGQATSNTKSDNATENDSITEAASEWERPLKSFRQKGPISKGSEQSSISHEDPVQPDTIGGQSGPDDGSTDQPEHGLSLHDSKENSEPSSQQAISSTSTGDHPQRSVQKPGKSIGPRSWSKFPSHTREIRTTSAGQKDKVSTRDFGSEVSLGQKTDISQNSSTSHLGIAAIAARAKGKGKRKTTRSMPIGKAFMQGLSRLTRTPSMDYKLDRTGHRSSIATGGLLRYPELEMLPGVVTPASVYPELGPTGNGMVDVKSAYSVALVEPVAESTSTAMDQAPNESSGKSWTNYYESCIGLPNFSEVTLPTANPGVEMPTRAPRT